jgi:hypothetical protein
VALAKDMNAATDEIVKLRSRAQREKCDLAELRAEELHIRESLDSWKTRHCTTSPDAAARSCELRR